MNTRDQKYAATIYEQVSQVKSLSDADQKKYGSMAHKLPILIRKAGLVQALTFVQARGGVDNQATNAYHHLLDHIAKTLEIKNDGETSRRQVLLEKARTAPLNEYMQLSQQVMTTLLWYKRFAQMVLGVEANDTDSTEGGN